jgi:hypothetical protein
MTAVKYLLAFAVAPLFFLAAAAQARAARRLPERRKRLLRQAVLYSLAGLVWFLFALWLHT